MGKKRRKRKKGKGKKNTEGRKRESKV